MHSAYFVILVLCSIVGVAYFSPLQDNDYTNDEKDYEEEEDESLQLEIKSSPLNITAKVGDTIQLPCDVSNTKEAVVQWTRGNEGPLGYAESVWLGYINQIKNDRFEKVWNNTLIIKKLEPEDANLYTCRILEGEGSALSVTHHLNILTPPKVVRIIPNVEHKTIGRGYNLTLTCEVKGFPHPTITWHHLGKHVKKPDRFGPIVEIHNAHYRDSGEYICIAANGQGPASNDSIRITVEDKPEIMIEEDFVTTGEGFNADLICSVQAHPTAKVTWQMDDRALESLPKHISHVKDGNKHILSFSATKQSDFGKYTCIAENKHGSVNKSISLTGKPSTPIVESVDIADDNKSPIIYWTLVSRSPITQYELMYKRQEDDEWITQWPTVPSSTDFSSKGAYRVQHVFTDLASGTYQAKIKAQNKYGWSNLSEMKTFAGVIKKEEKLTQTQVLEPQAKTNRAAQERISLMFILSLIAARYLR